MPTRMRFTGFAEGKRLAPDVYISVAGISYLGPGFSNDKELKDLHYTLVV
jgi:hypothetical protein